MKQTINAAIKKRITDSKIHGLFKQKQKQCPDSTFRLKMKSTSTTTCTTCCIPRPTKRLTVAHKGVGSVLLEISVRFKILSSSP